MKSMKLKVSFGVSMDDINVFNQAITQYPLRIVKMRWWTQLMSCQVWLINELQHKIPVSGFTGRCPTPTRFLVVLILTGSYKTGDTRCWIEISRRSSLAPFDFFHMLQFTNVDSKSQLFIERRSVVGVETQNFFQSLSFYYVHIGKAERSDINHTFCWQSWTWDINLYVF